MEYALGLLVFWAIIFAPLGIAAHWLALGASARVQALPLALPTGLALGVVFLSAARQAGIEAGNPAIAGVLLVAAIILAVAFRRWGVTWRSRELLGALLLGLLALVLLGMPLVDRGAGQAKLTGPVAYGTGHEPVDQIATAEAARDGGSGRVEIVRRAQTIADDNYTGFEQLLGFSAAAADAGGRSTSDWSPYALFNPALALIAALLTLPVFVLARWRGVRTLGLLAAVLLGVTSPLVLVAAGLAHAPGLLAALFSACALCALLMARRDRGWQAIAAVFAAATLVTAGPLAFIPFITVGITWMLLRGATREHLAHTDVPTTLDRPIALAVLAAMLSLYGAMSAMIDGIAPAWQPLHDGVLAAAGSWPLSWFGPTLELAGPREPYEIALALVGPALLAIAVAYGISRKELRELAIIVGAGAAVLAGALVAVFDRDSGIAVIEFSLLALAPLLAVVCVRVVAIARDARETRPGSTRPRFAGVGPFALILALLVMSVSAAATTGSRVVHAPPLGDASLPEGRTLLAAGDPWLPFLIDGDRAAGGDVVDADALVLDNRQGTDSLVYGSYDNVVLGTNPLSSDPPSRYIENTLLDGYGARLFVDTLQADDVDVESGAAPKRTATPFPREHHPAEGAAARDRKVGGLLVPPGSVEGCGIDRTTPCQPDPVPRSRGCTAADEQQARSRWDSRSPLWPGSNRVREQDDADRSVTTAFGGAGSAARDASREKEAEKSGGDDSAAVERARRAALQRRERPEAAEHSPLLGIACWQVPLDPQTRGLKVRVRDVGIILPPTTASAGEAQLLRGSGDPVLGGSYVRTQAGSSTLAYGADKIFGQFDVTVEGAFGPGVEVLFSDGGVAPAEPLRSAFGGFSRIFRDQTVQNSIRIRTTPGSAARVGRVFLRPVGDMARSCDFHISLRWPEQQRRTELAFQVRDDNDDPVMTPGLVLRLTRITESGGGGGIEPIRTAHLVLGNYMQRYSVPRYVLVDWTEQFESEPVERCGDPQEAAGKDRLPGTGADGPAGAHGQASGGIDG